MSTTSGNSNNDNTHSSFKMTSPVLTKEHVYSDWKYYLIVWEVLTSLQKNKQGLVVFLSFTVQDKQAVRTISVENLSQLNDVKL